MLFSSYEFIFVFFPIAYLLFHWLKGARRFAVAWLVLCSLFFYGYWKAEYLPLILGSILGNYGISSLLGPSRPNSKKWLTVGIAGNLALIGYFKYVDFLLLNVNYILGTKILPVKVVLPLAISFFTFQQIAYLVDKHKDDMERPKLEDYFLFVTFFPQLIAGPIVHFKEVIPQFSVKLSREEYRQKLELGLAMFAIGLFKKLVLADTMAKTADGAFNAIGSGAEVGFFMAFFGLSAYTLQIYLDFSAYSQMAIGIALLFGIRLPDNFREPYLSTNIIDFWRRWHITLSRFLRDYLYIPLGGNRLGETRRSVNLMITMLLGGLWHGAGWNFVIWGGLHGLYLMVNHEFRRRQWSMPKVLGWLVTLVAVMFAWIFFRALSLDHSVAYINQLLNWREFAVMAKLEYFGLKQILFGPALPIWLCALWVAIEPWCCRFRQSWLYAGLVSTLGFTALLFLGEEKVFVYFNF